MRQKTSKTPKARNNSAHISLQNYFERIFHSLEDKNEEYLQMKKYVRVYEESMDFLEIKKSIDMAAAAVYEINIVDKLNCGTINQFMDALHNKNVTLKAYVKGKKPSIQIKLLHQLTKHIDKIVGNTRHITKNMVHISEIVPVVKALLKMKDKDDEHGRDPILLEITNALRISLDEPDLASIKSLLEGNNINLGGYDDKLNFEHLNDISDKLIGLLNDKLMLIIGVSEFLIEGIDDGGANNVNSDRRLPDELRVLFLAASALNILLKIREIRENIQLILESVKGYIQILNGSQLDGRFRVMLKNGDNSVHEIISTTTRSLQMMKPIIDEITGKIENNDLERAMQLAQGLIYEKSNRIWENPYKM